MIINRNQTIYVLDEKGSVYGILPKKNYQLNYKLNGFDKQAQINFKGDDLLRGLAGYRRFASKEFGLTDQIDLMNQAREVVVAWGTLSINNDIAYQNYIIKTSGFDLFQMTQDFLRGHKQSKVFLGDIMAAYVALSKLRYSNDDIRENCLALHDLHWEYMDEMTKKEIIDNWQLHNITERNGIKSCEEFVELLKQGSLSVDWSEKVVH